MKKGTSVKFADPDRDMVSMFNLDDPSVYLNPGGLYTVNKIDIHGWHTEIMLDEMPGRWFNDMHFEEV